MASDAAALLEETRAALDELGVAARPTVQGSVAKGTWLRGSADIDLFLLLDPSTDPVRMETLAQQVGRRVLTATRRRYAQHPYLVGEHRGRTVDLVPACAVEAAGDHMSAVDRTPFHTAWVREHLDEAARDQVRLLKQWMKGTGVYGAETAVGGLSGYLVEVLTARFGGFDAVVDWLADGAHPRRLALGDDHVEDEVSPLLVADPVDPARNCAAAVQEETLARAVEAARAYRDGPGPAFFFPAPPRPEPRAILKAALARQGAVWIGLQVGPKTDRLDIVLPQFQKAGRQVAHGFADAGFPVHRWDVHAYADDTRIGFQWIVEDRQLPATRIHEGPAADAGEHAERFRAKWSGHPSAAGAVTAAEDGRLHVRLRVAERTPHEWISTHGLRHLTGKHVQQALAARPPLLSSPGQVDPAWAPRVADVVLDRRPWER